MVSASVVILEWVCPLLGVLMGNIMFMAPLRDCYQTLVAGKGLGELNPTPWAFMLGNCVGWVTYSILIQNYFVFFGNAFAILLAIWLNLQASKMQYETFRSEANRKSIVKAFNQEGLNRASSSKDGDINVEEARTSSRIRGVEQILEGLQIEARKAPVQHDLLVLFNATLWLGVISLVSFSDAISDRTKELIVGCVVNANLVVFYAAPLSTIWAVLQTRSASTIHIPTMLTNTANGTFWMAYGIAVFDLIIVVPNALGAILGAVQIVLCVVFPRTQQPQNEEEDSNSGKSQQETVAQMDS